MLLHRVLIGVNAPLVLETEDFMVLVALPSALGLSPAPFAPSLAGSSATPAPSPPFLSSVAPRAPVSPSAVEQYQSNSLINYKCKFFLFQYQYLCHKK